MRVNTIRLKMLFPILLLAVIGISIFAFMHVITNMEAKAMKKQGEIYFEAVAVILNADRDIYQARLALEEAHSGQIPYSEAQVTFDENAKQVYDRFSKYLALLKDEPTINQQFNDFYPLYEQWIARTKSVSSNIERNQQLTKQLDVLDVNFKKLRHMLDMAGESLRDHVHKSGNINQETLERYAEAVAEVLNADRDIYQARLVQQQIINGIGSYKDNVKLFEENALQAMTRFKSYTSLLKNEPNFTEPYKEFDTLFSDWFKDSGVFVESSSVADKTLEKDLFAQSDTFFSQIRDILDKAGEAVGKRAKESEQETLQEIESLQTIATIIIVIGFIIAFVIGFYIPVKITANVNNIARRIREISEGDGDLKARINSESKDELGDLAHEFDSFVERLQGIISIIQEKKTALGQTTSRLSEVSNSVNSLSDGLVGSSDSIVSAATEMNVANQQMAEVAQGTAHEATESSQAAQKGMGAVSSSKTAISELVNNIEAALSRASELEKSSGAIASVLEVIRGIAEQTNLLALNAAIEAARAGEHGRGFAVVADEVRQLATQTSESTNKIEGMISQLNGSVTDAFKAIENSRKSAGNTVESFDEVIQIFDLLSQSFYTVKDLSEQTANATQEQASVANDINENLIAMKDQTDGVGHASKEIRSQFNQLNQLYKELSAQVDRFKV
ncbi:methyl-accepting chemotaxis protein [Vibrio sp.]|nr:methyl-accepting chemotaxis protein [Vibrio sp.]